jgi:anion-transporting  ArsA/GET3 family ATPase
MTRFSILTGKGGVGKTTLAAAWALREAESGRRVLLAETHAGGQASALLGARTEPSLHEAFENLYLVDLNGPAALREYALMVVHFETVYRAVFENRLARHFLRVIPALGELTMLGKLWFHANETRPGGRPRFDHIVLDAPSTGHALAMLATPARVLGTVPAGRLRDTCSWMVDLLSAPQTALHVVTTPEEMPVNEAQRILDAARGALNIRVGALLVNQRLAAVPAAVVLQLRDDNPAGRALLRHQLRYAAGERQLRRLPADWLDAACSVPRLAVESFGRDHLRVLARALPA